MNRTKLEIAKELMQLGGGKLPEEDFFKSIFNDNDKRTTGEFNTEDLQRGNYPEGFEEIFGFKK